MVARIRRQTPVARRQKGALGMAGQVNIRLGTEDDADLTRHAAERAIERSVLVKEILREGLAACRDGRAMFDRPKELGPGDMIAMKAMLDHAVMEIDRIASVWAAHEAEMHKLERDDQLALTRARTEFIAGMPERITASLNPIKREMAALAERIEKQPRLDALDAELRAQRKVWEANTVELKALRDEPRRVTGVVLGDGRFWSTAFICQLCLMMMLIGWTALVPIFRATPLDVRMASAMLADDGAFCRLVERRYDRSDCQVPRSLRIQREARAEPSRSRGKGR
jgi:CRP-like cAMP-binding protein